MVATRQVSNMRESHTVTVMEGIKWQQWDSYSLIIHPAEGKLFFSNQELRSKWDGAVIIRAWCTEVDCRDICSQTQFSVAHSDHLAVSLPPRSERHCRDEVSVHTSESLNPGVFSPTGVETPAHVVCPYNALWQNALHSPSDILSELSVFKRRFC